MQKLDRLGWATGIAFTAYRVRVGFRLNVPQVPPELLAILPAGVRMLAPGSVVDRLYSIRIAENQSGSRVKRFHLAYGGIAVVGRSLSVAEVFGTLESDLHQNLAQSSRDEIFVHAGVVGWRGRAILIPGPSASGKSTLTAALVRAGALYYSDEFAVLDGRGYVRPFPRPMLLRENQGRNICRLTAAQLGSRDGTEPLRVGLVLLTNFGANKKWRPRRISAGKGILGLFEHCVQARIRSKASLRALQKVAKSSMFLKGARGEADHLAEQLLQNFDRLANHSQVPFALPGALQLHGAQQSKPFPVHT